MDTETIQSLANIIQAASGVTFLGGLVALFFMALMTPDKSKHPIRTERWSNVAMSILIVILVAAATGIIAVCTL